MVEQFIGVMEGRSYKTCVSPLWLAIGDGMDELLTDTGKKCKPFVADGCRCRSKAVVHVIAAFGGNKAIAALPTPSRALPPPPKEAPPSPPHDLVRRAQHVASLRSQLQETVAMEKEAGRAITTGGKIYVLVTVGGRYSLLNFDAVDANGYAPPLEGEWLALKDVAPLDAPGPFPARADKFTACCCDTPDSYTETDVGDEIEFLLHDAAEPGWVVARRAEGGDWGWFPFSCCRC